MELILNGEKKTIEGVTNVAELVAHLKLGNRPFAVEQNAAIVPRSRYAETALSKGDALEIITLIGGG